MIRALVLSSALLLLAPSARANELLTYTELCKDPLRHFKAGSVRFSFRFTSLQANVNGLLAHRGINSRNHIQIVTGLGASRLMLLVPRKFADTVTKLKSYRRGQELVIDGRLDRLNGNNGQVWFYVQVRDARILLAKPKPKPKPKPVTTGGSSSAASEAPKRFYWPATIRGLQANPQRWIGKRAQLRLTAHRTIGMPNTIGALGKGRVRFDVANTGMAVLVEAKQGKALIKQYPKGFQAVFKGTVQVRSGAGVNLIVLVVESLKVTGPKR